MQYRHTDAFVRVFRVQTIVWGAMFLGRAAIRLAFLVGGAGIGEYVVVAFFTGMPVTFAVVAWSIRHAINNLPPPSIGSSPAIASIVVFFQSNTVPPTSKNKACTSSITSA
jgi:hypothetical protein